MSLFKETPHPLLFAHRGASTMAPENTLEAFELALRLGADFLELDVRLTADGQVVVMHDANMMRTTNGRGQVGKLTYAEIRAFDAGYRFKRRVGYPFRDKGVYMPLLSEVLRAFPEAGFNIELKGWQLGLETAVLKVFEKIAPSQVLLAAFSHKMMRAIEATNPGCPLGMSMTQARNFIRASLLKRSVEKYAGRALQIPLRYRGVPVATPRLVRYAKNNGLDVHLWTLNKERSVRRWLEVGVDGIMTDDPGKMYGIFKDFRENH
mgnify:CR=1 FL=1